MRSVAALVGKDARILRRSPLLVALLVVYPLAVALLLGLALSGGPSTPKIALVNLVPSGASSVDLGTERLDIGSYAADLVEGTRAVKVRTRAEAERMVRDGEVAGAVVIPADTIERLRGVLSLRGSDDLPTVEVLTNDADPLQATALREMITARLAEANEEIGARLIDVASQYLKILSTGGNLRLFGLEREMIGLGRAGEILNGLAAQVPPGEAQDQLRRLERFVGLAEDNLALAGPLMQSVADPIRVRRSSVTGPAVSLSVYAAAVAASVSLLLVAVLLGAGLVALEREDRTFGRLMRSAVSARSLLASKVLLAGGLGAAVGLLVAGGLAIFVDLDVGRLPVWLLAAVLSGAACAAVGVAIGAVAPEVRAASLLAILALVPVVVIGLVPEGATSSLVESAIDGVSAIFPFQPGLRLTTAAFEHGEVAGPALHLAALALAWSLIAVVGLRRAGRSG